MVRPPKHTVDNYDYGNIDNKPNCKEKPVPCPKCFKRVGKMRLGHRHEFLKTDPYIWDDTRTYLLARVVIVHGHFALVKGTKAVAFDTGRNTVCDIGTVWKHKDHDCYLAYHINRKERKPDFTKSDE